MRDQSLYVHLARQFESQIKNGLLKAGDKMPSVREVRRSSGVSMSTVLEAYYLLERHMLITPKAKSGYYVTWRPARQVALPAKSSPASVPLADQVDQLTRTVFDQAREQTGTVFALGSLSPHLLPVAQLHKALQQTSRSFNGMSYEPLQGNALLRRQIAKRTLLWNGSLTEEDLVTTAGCMNALAFSLTVIARPGDTIAVESPVYFGLLQLAKSMRLKVIELPTSSEYGIDLDDLRRLLRTKKIAGCVLMSNFSNPGGFTMPAGHKKTLVELLTFHDVPLIEDDLYADVYFGETRPASCKTFDEAGIVLWCGSVSKTLAPGYRVGWVAPGRYKEALLQIKLYHALSTTALTHQVIGQFLENGRYDHHLRGLRLALQEYMHQFTATIADSFPEGTRVSRPGGGFMLWVEFARELPAIALFERALRHNIVIAPGRMFTLRKQFDNCIRLSYGIGWNEKIKEDLKLVGRLAGELIH